MRLPSESIVNDRLELLKDTATDEAHSSLTALLDLLRRESYMLPKLAPRNTWTRRFMDGRLRTLSIEIGLPQDDGAITGSVYEIRDGDQTPNRLVGAARIEPDGTITRFPGSTQVLRFLAARPTRREASV